MSMILIIHAPMNNSFLNGPEEKRKRKYFHFMHPPVGKTANDIHKIFLICCIISADSSIYRWNFSTRSTYLYKLV
jgi:hypothetical protein